MTCTSVFGVYVIAWAPRGRAVDLGWNALAFTTALMFILMVHELGHVWGAARHRMAIGWPWFLPFPFFVGTLGAVIRMKESPRTRQSLLEMSASGPLFGFAAIVLTTALWALWEGEPGPGLGDSGWVLQPPLLMHAAYLIVHGSWSPGVDAAQPLGFAAWIGCLVTALNLVPIGQLDGGHVVSALMPRSSRWIGWSATAGLLVAAMWWPGWAVWAVVVHFVAGRHGVVARAPEDRLPHIYFSILIACVLVFALVVSPWVVMPR
jgi:membrane-associated protease RseP (regulator of RpoE activity)